jgi:hypothetical protein
MYSCDIVKHVGESESLWHVLFLKQYNIISVCTAAFFFATQSLLLPMQIVHQAINYILYALRKKM